jgi:hypothetical protein
MSEQQHDHSQRNLDPARGTRYYSGLTHSAIRRPVGTLAIASVVLVLGLFFVDRLPVNLLPAVEYPLVRITVNYPGVAPEVMEEQVTRVLERNLSSVENLSRISSRASEGRTNVNLVFEHGVDLDIAMQNAARMLETARQQLPRTFSRRACASGIRASGPSGGPVSPRRSGRRAKFGIGSNSAWCRSCSPSPGLRRSRLPAARCVKSR